MYKVIHFFTDLKDNRHPYSVGDIFPRNGIDFPPQRYAELSNKFNLQGTPLIEYVEEENILKEEKMPVEDQETTKNRLKKSDISRMSTANLKSLAIEQGIDGAEDMSGADLKKVLIEHFGF